MKRKINSFIKSHNLINRIYDMLKYFNFFERNNINELYAKTEIKNKLTDIISIEELAKYFDIRYRRNYRKIELRCNLKDLINDLDYLKQYLD